MVKKNPQKHARQLNYINALKANSKGKINIELGRFQDFDIYCKNKGCGAPLRCASCGAKYRKPNEKKTDVNLTTYMLTDCFENRTDCIVMVSGDTDYEMPLKEIRRLFDKVEIIIAYPPKRKNAHLKKYCTLGSISIIEPMLTKSLLPDPVILSKSGTYYHCPPSWK